MLRNMLRPIFNTTLDQFLVFLCMFCFCLAETTIFIVFPAKNAFKDNPPKTRFKSTAAQTALCQSVYFLCIFHVGGFSALLFWGELLFSLQKTQNSKGKPRQKGTRKQDANNQKSFLVFRFTKDNTHTDTNNIKHIETKNKNQKQTLNQH